MCKKKPMKGKKKRLHGLSLENLPGSFWLFDLEVPTKYRYTLVVLQKSRYVHAQSHSRVLGTNPTKWGKMTNPMGPLHI